MKRDRTAPAKVGLSTWPTPLEPAPRLATALGLRPGDLWIKRDDLTGLGGGGNKVRKLEYTCAAALANEAQTLVTTGAAQSNHARLTAAGARLGLDVVLVLAGKPPATLTGNLALDGLFGARIEWAGDVDDHELDAIAREHAFQLSTRGTRTELIPFGGSSVLAAHGYVDCGKELRGQAPDLAHVVVAVGSGATMAGLVHALGSEHVYGVHTGAVADPEARVLGFVDGLRGGEPPVPGAFGLTRW